MTLLYPSRYAGNAVSFPGGDWWGQCNSLEDVDKLLSELFNSDPVTLPSPSVRHMWRGRLGLDEIEQEQLIAKVAPL